MPTIFQPHLFDLEPQGVILHIYTLRQLCIFWCSRPCRQAENKLVVALLQLAYWEFELVARRITRSCTSYRAAAAMNTGYNPCLQLSAIYDNVVR
jgi:hypothetical protein